LAFDWEQPKARCHHQRTQKRKENKRK
jgi:hypothetical protein